MTNNDELAVRMRNYLNTAVISKVKVLHLTTDELSGLLAERDADKKVIADSVVLFETLRQRIAELEATEAHSQRGWNEAHEQESRAEARELQMAEINDALCKLLPDCRYMDPPDGGSVTPLEQVSRMVSDYRNRIAELETVCAESYQVVGALADAAGVFETSEAVSKALDNLSDAKLVHEDVLPFAVEARTVSVKLPKPHAHLIWIQAGRGPDDYWDDVAVSHSLKDRCCDGSERYPVYSIFEIQDACAAAGIKLEVGEQS